MLISYYNQIDYNNENSQGDNHPGRNPVNQQTGFFMSLTISSYRQQSELQYH
jgi:hypothetical protein